MTLDLGSGVTLLLRPYLGEELILQLNLTSQFFKRIRHIKYICIIQNLKLNLESSWNRKF